MENIGRLLEITEVERNHELLLTVKNLRELGGSPFLCVIPIVFRSSPAEVIEGEHFVLVDLLKLIPSNSSQPTLAKEDQTKASARTLVRSARVSQPQSPRDAPRPTKKRKTRARQTKATDAGLEDFRDWTGVVDIEPVKEADMFSPAVEFAARKRKRSVTFEGADTPSSGEKRPRRSPSYEETQQDGAIVLVGSSDLASNDQPTLRVYLNEANIPLEGEVLDVSPLNVEEVGIGSP